MKDIDHFGFSGAGRCFLGSVDDSVGRHPWDQSAATAADRLASLNKALVYSAILGPSVCSRIGNLLYQDAYFSGLLNDELSPLRAFCRSGFYQLQMREDSILKTIESRLEDETKSTEAFWRKHSDKEKLLHSLDKDIPRHAKIMYARSFKPTFVKFMHHTAPHANHDFNRIYRKWKKEGVFTRTSFEELCKREAASENFSMQRAMSVANSVNHYAYVATLSNDNPGQDYLVETVNLPHLTNLICPTQAAQKTDAQAKRRQGDLAQVNAVLDEYLSIPQSYFTSPDMWQTLANIVGVQSVQNRAYPDFQQAKSNLQLAIRLARIRNYDLDYSAHKQLRDACVEYTKQLRTICKTGVDGYQVKVFLEDLLSGLPSATVGAAVGLPVAEVEGVLTGLGISTAINLKFNVISDVINKPVAKIWYSSQKILREIKQATPVVARARYEQIQTPSYLTVDPVLAEGSVSE